MPTPCFVAIAKSLLLAIVIAPNLHSADTTFTSFCECDGWTRWSPREEISPAFSMVANEGRDRDNALKLETKSRSEFGAWKLRFEDVKTNQTYRFTAWY